MHAATFCAAIVILNFFNAFSATGATSQSDRPLSFVREGLQLNVAEGSGWAYAADVNGTYKIIDCTGYVFYSGGASVDISCRYSNSGEGLFYVALTTNQASAALPLCAQPSADPVERARDFLERYQNWTQDSNLTKVISMLSDVDATKNCSVTVDELTLNVTSNPYLTSLYWKYTYNGTDYRGVGIAFVSKYVLFRDDRNLQLPPREPPAMDFSSAGSYFLGVQLPESDATNVPLNTDIKLMTSRPVGMIELHLNPEVEVSNVTSETQQYNGYYTFKLAEHLSPDTVYTATVLYGQTGPADLDSFPISIKSWTFTTGDSMASPESSNQTQPTISPTQTVPTTQPSSSPIENNSQNSIPMEIVYMVAAVAAAIAVVTAAILIMRRRNPKER